jgi:hypothetical protein
MTIIVYFLVFMEATEVACPERGEDLGGVLGAGARRGSGERDRRGEEGGGRL